MNPVAAESSRDQASLSATRIGLAAEESLPSDHRERFNSVVLPYLSDAYTLARWLTGSPADASRPVGCLSRHYHLLADAFCVSARHRFGLIPLRSVFII